MKRLGVVLGACLVAATVHADEAEACIHGDRLRRQVNPTLRDVRTAERLLARGRYQRAVRYAGRAFRQLDQLPPDALPVSPNTLDLSATDEPGIQLFVRAQRVAALAAVRSGGEAGPGRAWRGASEAQRVRNLMWAGLVLQFHAALQPDNTLLQVEYAEAATHVPFMSVVAHAVLSRLADDDLMPTARGYALLAKLQKDRGDEGGLRLSLARCNEITGDVGACEVA